MHYVISNEDMDSLIENHVADPITDWRDGELTFIETFQFTRKDHPDWIGPYHPRPLLEEILNNNDIEWELLDTDEETKTIDDPDHLNIDLLEEELRSEQSVMTRLNKGKIEE